MIKWMDNNTYSELYIGNYYIGRLERYHKATGSTGIRFNYEKTFFTEGRSMYYKNNIEIAKDLILKDIKEFISRHISKHLLVLNILGGGEFLKFTRQELEIIMEWALTNCEDYELRDSEKELLDKVKMELEG